MLKNTSVFSYCTVLQDHLSEKLCFSLCLLKARPLFIAWVGSANKTEQLG